MKFIVDAQLPRLLAEFLRENGHDAIHTLDLPDANATSDSEISRLSIAEQRIVISKDADFYNSFLKKAEPYKLLYLTIGNLSTNELIGIFERNLQQIIERISFDDVVEMDTTALITIL